MFHSSKKLYFKILRVRICRTVKKENNCRLATATTFLLIFISLYIAYTYCTIDFSTFNLLNNRKVQFVPVPIFCFDCKINKQYFYIINKQYKVCYKCVFLIFVSSLNFARKEIGGLCNEFRATLRVKGLIKKYLAIDRDINIWRLKTITL